MPHRRTFHAALVAALWATVWMASAGAQGPGRGTGPGTGGGGRAGRGAPVRDAGVAVGTGVISGTVVVEGTGTPVRRARVTLSGPELRGGRSVLTDDQGAFEFPALPAGRFTMTAAKAGYVDNVYGAKRAGRPGTPIQLADGQRLERAVLYLPRGGVITGMVVDDHGEPAAGTQVRALRYVMRTGVKTLQQVGQDQTDDRGIYRIYQLQPGDYVVNALPRNMTAGDLRATLATELSSLMEQAQEMGGGRGGASVGFGIELAEAAGRGGGLGARVALLQEQLEQAEQAQPAAYAPVYYPGTTSISSAATIALGISEERSGVDFQLQLVPTARVSGTITSPDGVLPQGTQIGLFPADQVGLQGVRGLGGNVTRVNPTGEFSFANVTPGEYEMQARATIREASNAGGAQGRGRGAGPVQQVFWASAPVSVGGQDLSGVTLQLQPGMTVSGRVEFTGAAAPPGDLSMIRVGLNPRGAETFEIGGTPMVQVDSSGRFSIAGVAPGQYVLTASLVGGGRGGRGGGRGGQAGIGAWRPISAMVGGQDALDFPLEVGPNQNVSNAVLTFTDRTQELSGTIQDTTGRPTSDFTIIVFPSDNRYWLPQARRIASTRPGTDGRFSFGSLPPGDYRLTAVTDVEPGEWYDPDFLTQLQQVSIPISLSPGQSKVQDIRLAGN